MSRVSQPAEEPRVDLPPLPLRAAEKSPFDLHLRKIRLPAVSLLQTRPAELGMNGPIDTPRLGELLDRHGGPLALYAAGWTSDPDDCVQEAFVELASQPTVPENVVAWLYRVVRNRALNVARGRRRRREHELQAAEHRQATATRGDASTQFDMLATREALDQLSELDRQIVVLRIWGGLKWDEIVTVTGLARTTVHRRYQHSLAELKNYLEPPCPHQIAPIGTCRPNG